MKITNKTTGALVLLYLGTVAWYGTDPSIVLEHVAWAALALALTFFLFLHGRFGGGDAKLLAATTLWIGGGQPLFSYIVLSGVFGGLLAMAILCIRAITQRYPLPAIMPIWLHRQDVGIPYGVALGSAGLVVVSDLLIKAV